MGSHSENMVQLASKAILLIAIIGQDFVMGCFYGRCKGQACKDGHGHDRRRRRDLNGIVSIEDLEKLDTNRDGQFSYEELRIKWPGHSEEEIRIMFAKADLDNNGFLNFYEFLNLLREHQEDLGYYYIY